MQKLHTPRNISMEPKHHPIEKDIIFHPTPFLGSVLIFQGVHAVHKLVPKVDSAQLHLSKGIFVIFD